MPSRTFVSATLGLLTGALSGALLGALLGGAARAWMRLISADPEFSWDGTIFIVGAFTFWGFAQGVVISMRRATSRRWLVTLTRVFGFVGMLPLFFGAGAILAPTVIAGGLSRHRTNWKTLVRRLTGVVALLPVVVVAVQIYGDFGLSWRWWAGMAGLTLVYGAVIKSIRGTMAPQVDGWRPSRFVWVLATIGVAIATVLPLIGLGLG